MKELQKQDFKLEPSLKRGVTINRIRVLLKSPMVLLKNYRFMRSPEVSNQTHIFVMGPPRNGTTLLQNIIKSHSEISGFEAETRFFFLRNFNDFKGSGIPYLDYKKIIDKSKDYVALYDQIADHYKQRTATMKFVEKTPEHALRLSLLLKCFPQSKFIFIVRDARDGFCSAKRNPNFKAQTVFSYSQIWKKSVQEYLTNSHNKSVYLVKYEELCENPKQMLQNIMEFIGVPFEESQLSTENVSSTVVSYQEGHGRLSEYISSKTVGSWEDEISSDDLAKIMNITGEQLKDLGY